MIQLTESAAADVLATVERDGYAVVPGVISPDDFDHVDEVVARIQAEYDRLVDRGELFRAGGTISGHINCHPGVDSKIVYDILESRGLLEIIRLNDPTAVDRVRVTMNYNLPHSHNQHFHSDGLFVDKFLVLNTALTDITARNGPMDVIPGSHQSFHKFWEYSRDRMYRRATPVCMKKGDVLVRFSTMWHRGTRNYTDSVRPMMSFTFGEASAPPSHPFDSDIVFHPNWYGTSRADEVRERAFVTVPAVYSAMRFFRSLVGNKGYASW